MAASGHVIRRWEVASFPSVMSHGMGRVRGVPSMERLDDQLITRSGNAPTCSNFNIEHVWFCIRISAFGKTRAER